MEATPFILGEPDSVEPGSRIPSCGVGNVNTDKGTCADAGCCIVGGEPDGEGAGCCLVGGELDGEADGDLFGETREGFVIPSSKRTWRADGKGLTMSGCSLCADRTTTGGDRGEVTVEILPRCTSIPGGVWKTGIDMFRCIDCWFGATTVRGVATIQRRSFALRVSIMAHQLTTMANCTVNLWRTPAET